MKQKRKSASRALREICLGFIAVLSVINAWGAFPAGSPVTPYLIGQNDWFFPPDSGFPTIESSGVTIIRIGGHTFDETAPLTDAQILHQVDMIRSIGAEPLIQVSRFALAATAAATVQFINGTNARNVKFWSIGNEPDLNYPGTETQLAADVAVYIKQISPAMRDVDPGITLIAPDMAFYSATKFNELLGGASDITGKDARGRYYIDCVSFHRYGGTTFTRADALNDMHGGFENNRVVPLLNRIAFANSLQGRTGLSALTWALTEFNMTTSNTPAVNNPAGYGVSSFLNGQFFAEYYRVAMKRGVAFMNSWSLLEGGGNGSAGDLGYLGGSWAAPVPRSSYYHMQMMARYLLPGGYLDSSSSSANVAVLSTRSSTQATLSVMILNEDMFDHTFSLRMDNGTVVGSGDMRINIAANLAAEYSGSIEQQSTVVLVFDAAGGLLKRVTYSLTLNSSNAAPTVEIFNAASAPTFSPAPGSYISAQSVTINSTTTSASIRYTTDGSTPTSSVGTLYSGPVAISTGTTFKAVAYSGDFTDSGVSTGAYTIGVSVPATPNLTATAASSSRVNLSWSGGAGATSFNVKRSTVSGGSYGTIATSVTTTTFSDIGLTPGTTYYYVVSGINANGESLNSNEASATTFMAAIGTTAAFEAESLSSAVSGSTISLNSDAGASGGIVVQLNSSAAGQYYEFTTGSVAAGAYSLQLAYKANNNRGQLNLTVDGVLIASLDQYAASASFLTATLGNVTFTSGGNHLIRLTVTGKNAASTGFLLSADRFIFLAQAAQVAAAPTGVMATNGDNRVVLNWTASPGAASHQVKRALTTGGPYTTIATGIITPTFTDTTAANGSTYYYVVSAVNALGESPNSFEAFATPQAGTSSVSFEAELLTFTTVPLGAATAINSDALTSGGKWVQLSANGTVQSITFTTGSVTAGTYVLQLAYKTGNNRAQVSVAVDGVTVGGTIDQYSAAATYPTTTVGSVTFASAGTHTIKLTVTGKNASSSSFAVSADRFTFAGKSAATLTLGNLIRTYDGTPKAVSTATTPSGLAIAVTYNGSSTAPTVAGAYSVVATINPVDPFFYGTVNGTLVIGKAASIVTWNAPVPITYGTPLGAAQLNATATVPGVFTYTPAAATILDAGAGQSLTVSFTPTDAVNYSNANAATAITVNQAMAQVALSNLVQTYDGTPKSATATTTPAGLAVNLTYDGNATAPTNAGSYVVVTSVNDANYTGSAAGNLIIGQASAIITLDNLIQAYDGMPKSVTAVTSPENVSVAFTYNGSSAPPIYPGSYDVVATITDSNHSSTISDTLVITVTALVRHAPILNGSVDGSVQVLLPERTTLNGSAIVSGDLLVPGSPAVQFNGHPVYGDTVEGPGSSAPFNYTVTLNGNAMLRHVIRRIAAIPMPVVAAPPAPTGTRNVSLNSAGQNPGDFATVRNLTLNGNADQVGVPSGTYGTFTVNGNSSLVFGVAGATEPSIYNLQGFTLNGNSQLKIIGPVIINLARGISLNGSVGSADHPGWLTLNIASGGLTLNGNATCDGFVAAPAGTVTINGNSTLNGGVICDRLTIDGAGLLNEGEPE
jgi:fibronectin type 3 domain-containing protein